MYDLCIIGGGASGIACAITAARLGLKCIIIEKEAKLGRKIYATGNGRCNITNHNFNGDLSLYYNSSYNNYKSFLNNLFNNGYPDKEVIDFLNSIGIATYDIDSYVYPHAMQASALMWALTDAVKLLDIDVRYGVCVEKIKLSDGLYRINVNNEDIQALNLVLACGGASYGNLGGSLKGYELADTLNIKCTDIRPSLCGLVTAEDLSKLAGVRVKATAKLHNKASYEQGVHEPVAVESGELQFTDYGISGIMIFNLSGKAGQMLSLNEKPYITIDFLPDIKDDIIINSFEKYDNRKPKAILNNFINDKLAEYIIGLFEKDNSDCIKYERVAVKKLTKYLHEFSVEIKELTDFSNAQVTSGGISLECINPTDMSIYDRNGIYAIGEITDIDGICGGYNLTYAVISGIRAGKGIYDKIKSDKNQCK